MHTYMYIYINYLFFVCAGSSLLLKLVSSCGDQELLCIEMARLPRAVASPLLRMGSGACGLSSRSFQALAHVLDSCGTWV